MCSHNFSRPHSSLSGNCRASHKLKLPGLSSPQLAELFCLLSFPSPLASCRTITSVLVSPLVFSLLSILLALLCKRAHIHIGNHLAKITFSFRGQGSGEAGWVKIKFSCVCVCVYVCKWLQISMHTIINPVPAMAGYQ